MAALKSNYVLPVAATVFIGLTGWAVLAATNGPETYVAEGQKSESAPTVFGVDGDNTADTLRSVEAIVQQQREDQKRLEDMNRELTAKAEAALADKEASEQRMAEEIRRAVAAEKTGSDKKTNQLQSSIEQLSTMMSSLQTRIADQALKDQARPVAKDTEVVPGFGLGGSLGFEPSGSIIDGERLINTVWIQPLDRPIAKNEDGSNAGFAPLSRLMGQSGRKSSPTRAAAGNTAAPSVTSVSSVKTPVQTEPFFTLPDLAALTGGVSATSLVGKIYTDEIKDPWPFKISIGRENFGANTVDLPSEIEGMLFEGYAVGDWTMSCVRGTIIAASFIFDDGTIVKAYGTDLGSRPKEAQVVEDSIGYIADPFGNPCISGEKHTSAPSFLAARMLAAGIEGYGTALGDAEITRQANTGSNGTTVTELVTGSVDRFAGANALESGAKETSAWLRARQGQVFDLIYAPSGSRVDVHLQQEIYIDKKPNARKVRYSQSGSRHADLD